MHRPGQLGFRSATASLITLVSAACGVGADLSRALVAVERGIEEVGGQVSSDGTPSILGGLDVRNNTNDVIILRSLELLGASGDIEFVGAAVLRLEENENVTILGSCGPFPPENFVTHPLEGFRLEPEGIVTIVLALRSAHAGSRIAGVRIAVEDPSGRRGSTELAHPVSFRAGSRPCPHGVGDQGSG